MVSEVFGYSHPSLDEPFNPLQSPAFTEHPPQARPRTGVLASRLSLEARYNESQSCDG